MLVEQQQVLLKANIASILAELVGNVLLAIVAYHDSPGIQSPASQRITVISLSGAPLLLCLLLIFTALLVQLGLLLIIVPGNIIAPGILLAIAFSLAPVTLPPVTI